MAFLFSKYSIADCNYRIRIRCSSGCRTSSLRYGARQCNPSEIFGVVSARTQVPSNNIILIGALVLGRSIPSYLYSWSTIAELWGPYCFHGCKCSTFVRYFLRSDHKRFWPFILPLLGFAVCLYLWLNLDIKAKIVGLCWLSTWCSLWCMEDFMVPETSYLCKN